MFFNHVARTIEHFAPLSLPWPVEYLLAHHSPKDIFGGSRLPSLGTIGKSLGKLGEQASLEACAFREATKQVVFSAVEELRHGTM